MLRIFAPGLLGVHPLSSGLLFTIQILSSCLGSLSAWSPDEALCIHEREICDADSFLISYSSVCGMN